MSFYAELDPMVEHRTQFTFKGKREHIAKVNMPNIAYPNNHIDILHGSRDHVIVTGTVEIMFNVNIESTDKTRSIVNNVRRALVKKKKRKKKKGVLKFGSKEIDTINNAYNR